MGAVERDMLLILYIMSITSYNLKGKPSPVYQ